MKRLLLVVILPAILAFTACSDLEPEGPNKLTIEFFSGVDTAFVGYPFRVFILAQYRNGDQYDLPKENIFTTNGILEQTGDYQFTPTAPGMATITASFDYKTASGKKKTFNETLLIPVVYYERKDY